MKSLQNRVNRISDRMNITDDLPDISVTIIESRDQAEHPENYERVLISEQAGHAGKLFKHFKLKPI